MKKLITTLFILSVLVITSCNKNQKAVKKLDGTWKVTEGVLIDFLEPGDEVSFTFDNCKLKKDEWCSMKTSVTSEGETASENQIYKVTEDGETITIKSNLQETEVQTINIKELSKNDAVFDFVISEEGLNFSFEIKLEKK